MKPINTSLYDFSRLIEGGYVYVDKTAPLYELVKPTADCIYYLPRPRRFGKSLMISTLKALFQGRRELFRGLAIEKTGWNRIWDLGKRVMSDMGGVYTLATSFGTRVHHNLIHDVWGYTYGGWALYTDEGSEGIVMEDNVCWNTTDGGFHQHYGVGCIIRNNVFAFNRERGAVRATRTEKDGVPCTLHFVNNIVAVDHGPLVCANARKVEGVWANNLWYDYRGKDAAAFGGLKWDEWVRAGKESGSRFADPKFRNPKAFDFTLEADSPAFQLGFRPFSLATAGAVKQKTGGGKR